MKSEECPNAPNCSEKEEYLRHRRVRKNWQTGTFKVKSKFQFDFGFSFFSSRFYEYSYNDFYLAVVTTVFIAANRQFKVVWGDPEVGFRSGSFSWTARRETSPGTFEELDSFRELIEARAVTKTRIVLNLFSRALTTHCIIAVDLTDPDNLGPCWEVYGWDWSAHCKISTVNERVYVSRKIDLASHCIAVLSAESGQLLETITHANFKTALDFPLSRLAHCTREVSEALNWIPVSSLASVFIVDTENHEVSKLITIPARQELINVICAGDLILVNIGSFATRFRTTIFKWPTWDVVHMQVQNHFVRLQQLEISGRYFLLLFCSASLPLASTRWVPLTLSSLCPLI